MGGEGNFRAAGIFFRYQIPCMNFFQALAKREVFKETKGALKFLRSGRKVRASSVVFTVDISPVPALYDFHMCGLYGCSQVRNFSFTA